MMRKSGKSVLPYGIVTGCLLLCLLLNAFSSDKGTAVSVIPWENLNQGLSVAMLDGPRVSKFADSKVTLVKINPHFYDFKLVASTENDSVLRTVKEWCEMKDLDGAINAGMYSLKDHISGSGYMQNYSHINNPKVNTNFNAMAVFNPMDSLLPPFQIVDMANQDWKTIVPKYHSCFQSIRMIDNVTTPVYWKHRPVLYCSMTLLGLDKSGNVLYIFTRTPYSVNEMINFLLKSPLDIKTVMYLEGGPEASIYVKTPEKEILKFGSYVSGSKPDDNNEKLRKMPNVLGFKRKQN